MSKTTATTIIDDLRPGDRVRVIHHEFSDWRPTTTTVTKLSIRFPNSECSQQMIEVRLDEHPFPDVYWSPIRDFSWDIGDKNIEVERV